jgi:ubiquinone/menaquinone biosynthesis C-methylase UbiE
MNWHETIEYIRSESSYNQLVEEAYFSPDLKANVELFRNSSEFIATLQLLKSLNINGESRLLDVGAGNGISSIAFALEGYKVTALEPDVSDTIGAGAIKKLKELYKLTALDIVSSYGEDMPFENDYFDIVFARQCMHHAYNLPEFAKSMYRVVKPKGIFLTVRDHVITDKADKQAFLKRHPLHKFYGGENAFKLNEYRNAIIDAGFVIKQVLGPADSVINYSPWSISRVKKTIQQKVGAWAANNFVSRIAWVAVKLRLKMVPGRLYTFVSEK